MATITIPDKITLPNLILIKEITLKTRGVHHTRIPLPPHFEPKKSNWQKQFEKNENNQTLINYNITDQKIK